MPQTDTDAAVFVAAASPARQSRRREYGLDWLRVIAFVILIGYHTGMYFVPWPWLVKNDRISAGLTWIMIFFNLWRLPLLFFIAGAGTWFNLRSRGYGNFVRERWVRLGLPLLVGMLLITPPQTYVERLLQGRHYASYFEFWGTVFRFEFYPQGNMSWIHLWFLPYLLTYSVAALPLLILLRGRWGRALIDRLASLCERPGLIYLLNVPSIASAILLGPHWPHNYTLFSDWAYFTGYLLTFLWGFIIGGSERFLGLVERRRREFLWVAGAAMMLVFAIRLPGAVTALSDYQRLWVFIVVDLYFAQAMILTLVGWARARLNRDSPALRWANTAVYPFYIFHQTITVVLGYAWRGWDIPLGLKFFLLFASTFLGSWILYELVRRTRVTRVMFGMKA